jgi:hypothetical protein
VSLVAGATIWALALLMVGIIVTVLVSRSRRELQLLVALFSISFGGRAVLIALNEMLNFFGAKPASHLPVEVYRGLFTQGLEAVVRNKFFIQTLVNIPAFAAYGTDTVIHVLTNGFFGALAGVAAYAYIARAFTPRAGLWAFALVSFFPEAVNFSIFALRDPMIYFFLVINAAVVTRMWVGQDYRPGHLFAFAGSFIGVFWLRPEWGPVAAMYPLGLAQSRQWQRVKETRSVGAVGLYSLTVAALVSVVGVAMYSFLLAHIGVTDIVSPAMVAEQYAEQRFDRTLGDSIGAGSHVLPPAVYYATPWYGRVFVQTIGILLVPLPWLLKSIPSFLAFADSVLLITCVVMVLRRLRRRELPRRVEVANFWMMFVFLFGVSAMGFIIINGGNAFRMRLCLLQFVVIPLAIYLGDRHPTWLTRRRPQPVRRSAPQSMLHA